MTGIQESQMDVRVGSMLQNRDLTRRQALLGSAAIGLAAAGTASAKILPRKRAPNILFILADDLGYADVSCYGRRDYVTPAIDSIASGGMRFTQGYANSAVCSATRSEEHTSELQSLMRISYAVFC